MKAFLILRVEKGDYYNSEKDAYVPLKDATAFYDETDAENTLSWLDDSREWCHSLIEKDVPSINDAKEGDVVIVFDPLQHDYEEREFLVESVEDEDGEVKLYGKDLSRWNEEANDYDSDDYLGVVDSSSFLRIKETTFFFFFFVDGRFTAEVKASSLDEAKKKAEVAYASASFGDLESIDSYPCAVEDLEGNTLWTL